MATPHVDWIKSKFATFTPEPCKAMQSHTHTIFRAETQTLLILSSLWVCVWMKLLVRIRQCPMANAKKNSFLIKKIICTQCYAVFLSLFRFGWCALSEWGEHAKCRCQPYFFGLAPEWSNAKRLFFFLSPTASVPKAIILDESRNKKREFNICIYIWYFYHLMCANFCVFSAILFRLKNSHFVYRAFDCFAVVVRSKFALPCTAPILSHLAFSIAEVVCMWQFGIQPNVWWCWTLPYLWGIHALHRTARHKQKQQKKTRQTQSENEMKRHKGEWNKTTFSHMSSSVHFVSPRVVEDVFVTFM